MAGSAAGRFSQLFRSSGSPDGTHPSGRVALSLGAILILLAVSCSAPRVDRTELEAGIRDLLQLRTYEQIYRAVGYISQERSVLIFKTVDRQLLYAVNIRVQAGIDLSEGFTVEPDPGDPDTVTVSLPPARILAADADESSIRQYFSHEHGGAVSLLDYGDQLAALKEQTIQDAVARGILTQARENAKKIVQYYLRSTGIREVKFTVAGGSAG